MKFIKFSYATRFLIASCTTAAHAQGGLRQLSQLSHCCLVLAGAAGTFAMRSLGK